MFFLYALLGAMFLLGRPLLTLLHELGHAGPALLFTRGPVTVYLGSYGDSSHSWHLQLGRLEVYLTRRLFWVGGCCLHGTDNLSRFRYIIIALGGVGVSVALVALAFGGALALDLHGSVKLFLFFLTLLAAVDVVNNLYPAERGGIASDGLQLKRLLTGNAPASLPDVTFSPELKELISRSRDVAIDLGYGYISSVHFLLADCAMPYAYSLAPLLFPNPDKQAAFYEELRLGPATPGAGALPLTLELERALQLAHTTRRHGLGDTLTPAHLLIAASEVPGSALAQVVTAANLPHLLLTHYRPFGELWATQPGGPPA